MEVEKFATKIVHVLPAHLEGTADKIKGVKIKGVLFTFMSQFLFTSIYNFGELLMVLQEYK